MVEIKIEDNKTQKKTKEPTNNAKYTPITYNNGDVENLYTDVSIIYKYLCLIFYENIF